MQITMITIWIVTLCDCVRLTLWRETVWLFAHGNLFLIDSLTASFNCLRLRESVVLTSGTVRRGAKLVEHSIFPFSSPHPDYFFCFLVRVVTQRNNTLSAVGQPRPPKLSEVFPSFVLDGSSSPSTVFFEYHPEHLVETISETRDAARRIKISASSTPDALCRFGDSQLCSCLCTFRWTCLCKTQTSDFRNKKSLQIVA